MKNKVFEDLRGYNMKFFQDFIAEKKGFGKVKEVFATTNKKGTIRAFHFQDSPKPQQKIVKPLAGSFNIRIIDTKNKKVLKYDNWNNLSEPIFVEKGNMLGYIALEENSVMLYIADEEFVPELNSGVNPYSFNMDWNFEGVVTMSERDKNAEIVEFE